METKINPSNIAVNIYTTEFFAICPFNEVRVKYTLRIETFSTIKVENIICHINTITEGFHEDIANDLQTKFGGYQILNAEHHGVHIETRRGAIS